MEGILGAAFEYCRNRADIQCFDECGVRFVVFLWIVFGSILGGTVHDYMSGMISSRHEGALIAELKDFKCVPFLPEASPFCRRQSFLIPH